MKLTTAVNATQTSGQVGRKRGKDEMIAFWEKPENHKIIRLGRFLLTPHDGKSLAAHLLDRDGVIEFPGYLETVEGFRYPLNDGYKISLKNLAVWGCPACGSAPGSAQGKSAGIEAGHQQAALEGSLWYYNVATKHLFVISPTCFGNYVKALGTAKYLFAPYDLNPKPETKAPVANGAKK